MNRLISACFACAILCIAGAAFAIEERWVLASASNPGQAGTRWTTDVWVYTPVADAPVEVSIAFLPDVEGTADPGEVTIDVPAVTAVEIRDVVESSLARADQGPQISFRTPLRGPIENLQQRRRRRNLRPGHSRIETGGAT